MDKIRFFFVMLIQSLISFSDQVSDEEIKNRAADFLNRKDLRQIIRREICFGLIPKTLTRE